MQDTGNGQINLSDETFMQYILEGQNYQAVLRAILVLIKTKSEKMTESTLETSLNYAALLIVTPETFFPGTTVKESVNLVMQEEKNLGVIAFVSKMSRISPRDLFERTATLVAFALGTARDEGLPGILRSVRRSEALLELVSVPGVPEIFRQRFVWGLAGPVLQSVGNSGSTGNTVGNISIYGSGVTEGATCPALLDFLGCSSAAKVPFFASGLLFAFPSFIGTLCVEFVLKPRGTVETLRKDITWGLNKLAENMYRMFRVLISKHPEIKDLFTEYVCRVYEENKERRKTQYDRTKVLPDSYVINLSNVLAKFVAPLEKNQKQAEAVSLTYLQRCPWLKNQLREFAWLSGSAPPSFSAGNTDPFVTRVFYCKYLINIISYLPLGEELTEKLAELERLRKLIPLLRRSDPVKAKEAQMYFESLFAVVEYLKMLFVNSDVISAEVRAGIFSMRVIEAALRNGNQSWIPASLLENTIQMPIFFMHSGIYVENKNSLVYSEEAVGNYVSFCAGVLTCAGINVNYKQLAVHLLLANSYSIEWMPDLLSALIGYFVEIQGTIRNSFERMEERYKITAGINILVASTSDYRHDLRCLLEKGARRKKEDDNISSKITPFLVHTVSLLIEAQERGFEELKKTGMIEQEIEKAGISNDEFAASLVADDATAASASHLRQSLSNSMETAKMYFMSVREVEKLMHTMMRLCPRAFLDPLVLSPLVSMLNSSLMSLVGNRSRDLKVRDKEKCNFSPQLHLAMRIGMYTAIRTQAFSRAVLQDGGMFRQDLFLRALDICESRGVLTQGEKAQGMLFLRRLENTPEEEELGEFPEEFLDPLTFGLMREPVVLATSNTRVDRATATMILINDPHDPFTREPMKEADIRDDPDLKARIELWLESRKAQGSEKAQGSGKTHGSGVP